MRAIHAVCLHIPLKHNQFSRGDIMQYKETARSPHYGRIFAYDASGKRTEELDILRVKLVHGNEEVTIKQLLEEVVNQRAINLQQEIALTAQKETIDKQTRQIQLIKEALKGLNERLYVIESKNKVL